MLFISSRFVPSLDTFTPIVSPKILSVYILIRIPVEKFNVVQLHGDPILNAVVMLGSISFISFVISCGASNIFDSQYAQFDATVVSTGNNTSTLSPCMMMLSRMVSVSRKLRALVPINVFSLIRPENNDVLVSPVYPFRISTSLVYSLSLGSRTAV